MVIPAKSVAQRKPCKHCGDIFKPRTHGKRGVQKYCNHRCYCNDMANLNNKGRFPSGMSPYNLKYADLPRNAHRQPLIPCIICGDVLVTVYGSGRCKSCGYKAKQKSEQRTWKSGYVYSSSARYPDHILVAERALGRKLLPTEHVHHVNMNKADNRNTNLLICSNRYHKWLHNEYARQFARRI